jgi:diguanylate cyclase (GGDEF)-like protein
MTARLRYCGSLPTLPGVATRLLELANRADASMAQISECIALDPALSAKFLKMARSPLYMTRRTATNVQQAVNLMGTHAAIMTALSFSLAPSTTRQATEGRLNLDVFWRRSLLAAWAARTLGERLGYKKLDDLFLAGLLQDIGILALDTILPEEYERVNSPDHSHQELLDAERHVFGAGHDEVGYWLLKHWKLPDYLALSCLSYHNASDEKEPLSRVTACIAASGHVADYLLDPAAPHRRQMFLQSVQACLGVDETVVNAVLDTVSARMAALAPLFDMRLQSAEEAEALLKEARDLQMLRQLSKAAELERAALRDALTGAHHRSYLESVLQREFELATQNDWPLSMAMLDLDHFNKVNHLYGHQVGNDVLVAMVRQLQAQIRPDDLLARADGARFILLMPGATHEHAQAVLQRLQDSLAAMAHAHERGTPFHVTVSIGYATHMEADTQFDTPQAFMLAMESALQRAQDRGSQQLQRWGAQPATSCCPRHA